MDAMLTVTAADLDAAITALEMHGEGFNRCEGCLLAKALQRQFGGPATVGLSSVYVRGQFLELPEEAIDLISIFDNQGYDALRALLPVSFPLEARA